ncbi:hypothetical protein MMC13_003208 [Lambiella insularis]|nr:hypothetical protein [Lambiella insularis]
MPVAWQKSSDMTDATQEANGGSIEPALPAPQPSRTERRSDFLAFGRKRSRSDVPTYSSDPPLFSSDDLPAALENYSSHRSKRQYQGTWWDSKIGQGDERFKGPIRKRREFKRHDDSGVWLNSDDTEFTEDGDLDIEASFGTGSTDADKMIATRDPNPEHGVQIWRDLGRPVSPELAKDLAQREAARIVQERVDDGCEVIDLSALSLGQVLDTTLKPLHYLTLQERHYLPPSEEAYRPLIPRIHLYLARNDLSELPCEVYKLQNLVDLSARQNNLSAILPSVSKLTNLESLNLSANKLRYLPFELMELLRPGNLVNTFFRPNPFIIPVSPVHGLSYKDAMKKMSHSRTYLKFAATHIAYLQIDGLTDRGSLPSPSSTKSYTPSSTTRSLQEAQISSGKLSRAPSLLELAIRGYTDLIASRCNNSIRSGYEELQDFLPNDAPPSVLRLLKTALEAQKAGGYECDTCKKSYVIPRVEWIEWWQTLKSEEPLPFMRRGCSWACTGTCDLSDMPEEWNNCGWDEGDDCGRSRPPEFRDRRGPENSHSLYNHP